MGGDRAPRGNILVFTGDRDRDPARPYGAPLRRVPIGLVLFQVAAAHACASVRKLRVGRHGPGHSTTATTAQLDEQNLFFSTWWWWW